MSDRSYIKDKKRIVIKIGSSSLVHPETGDLNLVRIEKLVRIITDQCNEGKEVVLVSSGAIAVGIKALGLIGMAPWLAKLIADTLLYFLSYRIQQQWVFRQGA